MGNYHRHKNFWEPTFNPNETPLSEPLNWTNLKNNNGPLRCVCKGFHPNLIKDDKIVGKEFNICDFTEDFFSDKIFTFSNCIFKLCHFGKYNWTNIKFSKCKFSSCTFGLTIFKNCNFIDCKYENMGVSSQTYFYNTSIDPKLFLQSISTNVLDKDILKQNGTTEEYQKNRLFRTKSKIARNILLSLKHCNDVDSYIDSVEIFSNLYNTSRIVESSYKIKIGPCGKRLKNILIIIPRILEHIIIKTCGKLNRWGFGIGRISLIGLLLLIIYSSLYYTQSNKISESVIKAFDILTLVGYSKYSYTDLSPFLKIIQISNLIFGIGWFSLFFPTIINRININNKIWL